MDKARLPNASAECGYCASGFRFDEHRQECVKCSEKIKCEKSNVTRTPCQDMAQFFDHDEDDCLSCPDNYLCNSLSLPRPKPEFVPQSRADLATVTKILLPYWIDDGSPTSNPLGRECFSKRKDDRKADCDVSDRVYSQVLFSVIVTLISRPMRLTRWCLAGSMWKTRRCRGLQNRRMSCRYSNDTCQR